MKYKFMYLHRLYKQFPLCICITLMIHRCMLFKILTFHFLKNLFIFNLQNADDNSMLSRHVSAIVWNQRCLLLLIWCVPGCWYSSGQYSVCRAGHRLHQCSNDWHLCKFLTYFIYPIKLVFTTSYCIWYLWNSLCHLLGCLNVFGKVHEIRELKDTLLYCLHDEMHNKYQNISKNTEAAIARPHICCLQMF